MGLVKRRVPTKSGATAVQVARYQRGQRKIVKHMGSAHDEATLALLEAQADELIGQMLGGEQQTLVLEGLEEPAAAQSQPGRVEAVGSQPRLLWETLGGVYEQIFGAAIDSEVFKKLVLARIIEPTSKSDAVRVLTNAGVAKVPSVRTIWRHLAEHKPKQWREAACQAAYRFVAGDGAVSVVLYDVTTLYFETDEEDQTRKVGFSKERRVDPQIVVGLLVDKTGFPLDVHCFEGNKAETHTLIPVLDAFRARHHVEDVLVVADAGMLSYANLTALEEAGYQYIVGTRNSKAPYDLAEVFEGGNHFADGQVFETTTQMKKNVTSSTRRAVWQYRLAREHRDRRNQTKQLERAEDIAAGRKSQRRARFLTGGGPKSLAVDYDAARKAEFYFGLKGYVTSASTKVMTGAEVIAAYHSLFEVERSFRMAESDLAARPMFHHTRDSIEAHLTVVFCALAISRHIQSLTGLSIKKVLHTLEPLRDSIIEFNGVQHQIPARPTPDADHILQRLAQTRH